MRSSARIRLFSAARKPIGPFQPCAGLHRARRSKRLASQAARHASDTGAHVGDATLCRSRAECRTVFEKRGNQQGKSAFLVSQNPTLNSQKRPEVADHFLAGPRKREKGCLFLGILASLEKTTSRALTHMARLATPCSRALWVLYGCAHARHAFCALESRCSWHRYGLLSYFPAIALFHPEGFFTGDAALCVGMNANTLQVACRLRTRLRRRRSMCKVDELPVFLVTPLHDHHQLAARSSHHDCERTALAAVMESVSLTLFPSLRISRFSRRG